MPSFRKGYTIYFPNDATKQRKVSPEDIEDILPKTAIAIKEIAIDMKKKKEKGGKNANKK